MVVGMGPVVGNLYGDGRSRSLLEDLEIWSVGMLPLEDIPGDLSDGHRRKAALVTIEEALSRGRDGGVP